MKDKLINFIKRLVKDSGHKIFFIQDNPRGHHARVITKWLEKQKDEIEALVCRRKPGIIIPTST